MLGVGRLFRQSRAAKRLHLLFEQEEPSFKWYDFKHPSTNAIVTDEARERGLDMLIPIAASEQEFKRNWVCHRWVGLAPHSGTNIQESLDGKILENPPIDPATLCGFKAEDLEAVLTRYEIPYGSIHKSPTFPEQGGALPSSEKQVGSDLNWTSQHPASPSVAVLRKPLRDIKTTNTTFRGPLSSLLQKAVDASSDPKDYRIVWEELRKLVIIKRTPLVEFIDNEFKYFDDEGDVKFFKLENLRRRLRNMK